MVPHVRSLNIQSIAEYIRSRSRWWRQWVLLNHCFHFTHENNCWYSVFVQVILRCTTNLPKSRTNVIAVWDHWTHCLRSWGFLRSLRDELKINYPWEVILIKSVEHQGDYEINLRKGCQGNFIWICVKTETGKEWEIWGFKMKRWKAFGAPGPHRSLHKPRPNKLLTFVKVFRYNYNCSENI